MSQNTSTFDELADTLAKYPGEIGTDIQRYVVVPTMLDMIGQVDGKEMLELYCGAGYLSRRLVALGAKVTAVDTSERLIEIAGEINARESHNIRYAVVDTTDLSVIGDSTFDDIVCNMGLMTARDLNGTIAELARLVKLGGRFIFSVLHPCYCMPDACWARDHDGKMLYRTVDNYFSEGWWNSDLVDVIRSGRPKIKHRTLSRYVNALSSRGFSVRRIMEPIPSHEMTALKPELEVFERIPPVMIVEAEFPFF